MLSSKVAGGRRPPGCLNTLKQIEALQREADALPRREVDGVIPRIKQAIVVYGLTAEDSDCSNLASVSAPGNPIRPSPVSPDPIRPHPTHSDPVCWRLCSGLRGHGQVATSESRAR